MRAGQLRHRAEILELGHDLSVAVIASTWIGIKAKESADPPMATSLRSAARVEIRARFSSKLFQGRYLRHQGRLFYITSARDPMGTKAELVITADEMTGSDAIYSPQSAAPIPCRVLIQHEAPWLDEFGAVTDYKTRAEVAIIETGRAQVGDQITVQGVTFSVIAYADGSDDGVVRGLWLDAV